MSRITPSGELIKMVQYVEWQDLLFILTWLRLVLYYLWLIAH
jgi:hypothetical protein